MRIVVDATVRLGDADQPEQVDGPLASLGLGHVLVVLADHLTDLPAHFVVGVQAGQRVLEDHADLGPAHLLEVVTAHGEQVPALEQRGAADPGAADEAHDGLSRHALA